MKYAPAVLRWGLSLVFLWFGLNEIFLPEDFLGYLPSYLPLLEGLIIAHGVTLTLLGLLLAAGIFTRYVAIILALMLLQIIPELGYNEIMVRDVGLFFATVSVALRGQDSFCLYPKE